MKRILALVLAAVMMMSVVVIVSADETKTGDAAAAGIQNFEFETNDARNMFDNQVIYIDRIAEVIPTIDGVVGTGEYTTKFTLSNFKDQTQTAQGYFSYANGYVYAAVVKEAGSVTDPYDIQVDVGNAANNHPYVTVDRVNNRILADGTIKYNSYMCREDAGWGDVKHPRRLSDPKVETVFITEAVNNVVGGQIIIEMKLDAVEIMRFFAEYNEYREGWDVEMNSQAICFMIWLDNITTQYCGASIPAYFDIYWPGQSIAWGWIMHTIVLPEKPAARYVTKTPAGEMKFEDNDARNMFEKMSKEDTDATNDVLQVLTVSKIAETLPTLDGIVGTGEYTDSYEIVIYNNTDRKAKLHMSYKDGYLYMGVQMPRGEAAATQVDMGIGESAHPYTTVNRTTHQIKADGSLGGSGQLIRCDDQAVWNVRGNHPSGSGAAFIDTAATSFADGVQTFEYVVDTVRLIKWFATHEAYYDWDTVIATRCVMWQIWGSSSDTGNDPTGAQYCVPSMSAYFDIFWPGQTITWNWAKHTIVLPEAPASHLEKYVEPPYDADKDLKKIDYAAAKWNDLLYTVDFSGNDGYFAPAPFKAAANEFDFIVENNGATLTVKGKEGGSASSDSHWGGVIGGLDANSTTYYTMVYKVRANGNGGKNNSVGIGGWILDQKAHNVSYYNLYSNHNTNSDNRAVTGKGSGKVGDQAYVMFNTLAKYAVDADGFMTMMVEYDGINGKVNSYFLGEGKTGTVKEDWVVIKSDSVAVGENDMFGFEMYHYYNAVNTTIKDVKIYKGTAYKSEEIVPVVTTETETETTVTETETTTVTETETTTVTETETTTVTETETTTVGGSETETTTAAGEPETTAGTTEPTTTTGGSTTTEKKGCGSSIVSSMVVLAIIGCGAVVASKKRK